MLPMLTKTTEVAIQALLYLTLTGARDPLSPRAIATAIQVSPTYLAKIASQLVRANLLRAHRGVKGGVTLARPATDVTLLDVMEALQGKLIAGHCGDATTDADVCAYHDVLREVRAATAGILAGWTLHDLAQRPLGRHPARGRPPCHMECLRVACGGAP
jgi:Rrf2 family protein